MARIVEPSDAIASGPLPSSLELEVEVEDSAALLKARSAIRLLSVIAWEASGSGALSVEAIGADAFEVAFSTMMRGDEAVLASSLALLLLDCTQLLAGGGGESARYHHAQHDLAEFSDQRRDSLVRHHKLYVVYCWQWRNVVVVRRIVRRVVLLKVAVSAVPYRFEVRPDRAPVLFRRMQLARTRERAKLQPRIEEKVVAYRKKRKERKRERMYETR